MSNDYNGWTNYETWRVNLEIFDGFDIGDVPSTIDNPHDLADYLQEMAGEVVFSGCSYDERRPSNLMEDYARAFLENVNWREIAEYMIEEYKLQNQEEANHGQD